MTVLKDGLALQAGEVVDATFMSKAALVAFLVGAGRRREDAGRALLAAHEGHDDEGQRPDHLRPRVRVYFADLFEKHGETPSTSRRCRPEQRPSATSRPLEELPADRSARRFEADDRRALRPGPAIAMVNSDKGITNLHVPSDVIIDASMPPMIRDSGGCMWNADGELQDAKAVIPDSQLRGRVPGGRWSRTARRTAPSTRLDDGQRPERRPHGAEGRGVRLATTRRSRSPVDGHDAVVDADGNVLMSHDVEQGDIWRACQAKDAPIRDWVKLAVTRARATGAPAVFWLNRDARTRRAADPEGRAPYLGGPRHRRARRSRSWRPVDATRFSSNASAAARTRSRSPATCCATTSPISSRSSSSARARRCSRSSR